MAKSSCRIRARFIGKQQHEAGFDVRLSGRHVNGDLVALNKAAADQFTPGAEYWVCVEEIETVSQ